MLNEVYLNLALDYIKGYLSYGHYEGTVFLTDEELKQLKENPKETIKNLDLVSDLELKIDGYKVEGVGDIIDNITIEEID